MKTLLERASRLTADGIFLGGPAELFETGGRKMLITLLSQGLTPTSKVLDIGCGCLRAGYWLIHFLDSGCYFGIEPNTKMLEGGIRVLLEPGLEDLKKPRFDHNADFDFTVFHEKFDFLVARSIWTHASKKQIQTMLDGVVSTNTGEGFFLTSYWKPTLFNRDYKGTEGRQKTAHHSLRWIQTECANRGLVAEEIKENAYNFGSQTWIRIKPRAA